MKFIPSLIIIFIIWTLGVSYAYIYYSPNLWTDNSNLSENYSFNSLLINNLTMLATNLLSFIMLGIPAIINVFMNGYVFGTYLVRSTQYLNIRDILILVLPHAPFEILGLILSAYTSVHTGFIMLAYVFGKYIKKSSIQKCILYGTISLIVTCIGAVIENIIIHY